jgi:hypothetical protein
VIESAVFEVCDVIVQCGDRTWRSPRLVDRRDEIVHDERHEPLLLELEALLAGRAHKVAGPNGLR